MNWKRLLIVLAAVLLLVAACQDQQEPIPAAIIAEEEAPTVEPTEPPTAPPEATEQPTEEPTPEPAPTAAPLEASAEQLDEAFSTFLADMESYNIIGLEDANLALAEAPSPFLLDVRQPEEAEEKGHIPGAVLIPLRELGESLDLLPSFETPIIAYCGSGWRATIAATALEAIGWKDVKVLKDGSFSGWVEAGYETVQGMPPDGEVLLAAEPDPAIVATVSEMLAAIPEGWGTVQPDALNTELIENGDIILIDVRRPGEVDEKGYIDAADEQSHLVLEEFIAERNGWPQDLSAPIVVYCGSGHRSTIAMTILRSYGYDDVRSLVGGFGGWADAGYPVAGGAPPVAEAYETFLGNMQGYGVINLEDANVALLEDPAPFLLDVRQPEEAEESGHIPGAVLIPLRELAQSLDKLPATDVPIIAYCGSGWRATIAMTALQALGWEDVKTLKDGSFSGWAEAGYPVEAGVPPEAESLNAADPDPRLVETIDAMLQGLPEGWGTIRADALNTELIENPDIILVDVRRDEELAQNGIIDTPNEQIHIPLESFVAEQTSWPGNVDAPIVVYCGSGHRSTIAMTILRSMGYTDVRSLVGGFSGWAEAGYPETEAAVGNATLDEAFANFLGSMEAYNIIGLEDTNLALVEDPPPFLLDVREVSEVEEKGHIESAVLIPLRELAQNIQYLPTFDTPIIIYCGSGWRATIAMTALEAMGWENVKVLKDGSFNGWVEAGYPVIEGLPPDGLLLDVASPDPATVAQIDSMLQGLPEAWGTVNADTLNTELIENPNLILFDVRRNEEIAENGVIESPNLIVIPLESFIAEKELWPTDPAAEIVVYCGSGHRSTIAMSILRSYGYDAVRSLVGGFGGWAEAGYPVAEYAAP